MTRNFVFASAVFFATGCSSPPARAGSVDVPAPAPAAADDPDGPAAVHDEGVA
jgi:hypothetical protein